MAATALEVMRRQLDQFTKQVAEISSDTTALEGTLTAMRDVSGNDTNAVVYELMVAARTDEKLRATLQVAMAEYARNMYQTARAMPGVDLLPPEHLAMLVAVLTNTFDGAALMRSVLPNQELEDGRIALLMAMLNGLGVGAQS